jgi:hypothetical protein
VRYSVEDITRCTVAIHLYRPSLQQRAPTSTVVAYRRYDSFISVQVRVCTVSIFCLQGLCSLALSNAINGIRGIEPLSSKHRGIDTYCASYTNATAVLKNAKQTVASTGYSQLYSRLPHMKLTGHFLFFGIF